MRRRPSSKVDIDVVPYLSIMVIVLKLIGLILVVVVIPIALNPKLIQVLSYRELHQRDRLPEDPIAPAYLDCRRDGVTIEPEGQRVGLEQLAAAGNAVEQLLDRVAANAERQYVILIVRPQSVAVYRQLRKLIRQRPIRVAYDVLDENTVINWNEEARLLNLPPPG